MLLTLHRWLLTMSFVAFAAIALVGCGGDGQSAIVASSNSSKEGPTSAGSTAASNPALVFTGDTFPSPTDLQAVYTIDLDGSEKAQITGDGLENFLPHFSPDGTKLLYTKFARGGYGSRKAVTDIVVYDRATTTETRLTRSGSAIQAVWSPDGRQIAYGTYTNDALWVMNADGSAPRRIASPSRAPDDIQWGDYLWSSDNWIYFTVAENIGGCAKVRIDRIRPDGRDRTKISDGGPSCTPAGLQQSGDADPGISPDGKTLYSSRGLPRTVPGRPEMTIRHLYKFSSDPYAPGKTETDLSLPAKADCIAGVPKVSPLGDRIALFLFCASDPQRAGITLTDPAGTAFNFVAPGFAPDWHPAAR